MEDLEIGNIELTPTNGMGSLKISYGGEVIHLRWDEDWDCEAFSDTIVANLPAGGYSHAYYAENNYSARTEMVNDRNRTIRTLEKITEHLAEGDSPEHQKARQAIRELVKLI